MKRKNVQQKNKINFNLKRLKTYVLGGTCGCLAITSVFLTIESATSGAEIANLQKKESTLLTQQQSLQESLVQALSINSLQEKSNELGFTKIGTLVYITGAESVARLP